MPDPGYHDADIVLRLYEMRREEVMRRSRDTISFGFWPRSWDDVAVIMDVSHPDNAAWRQVASYWEMVYGLARRGIVDPEFLVENNGEGLLLYTKLRPFLERLRSDAPTAFQNAEWAATQTDVGRQRVEHFTTRFADQLATEVGA